MSEERKKVLEMLAAGKITAEEAERLLDKLAAGTQASISGASAASETAGTTRGTRPKYLRVVVGQPGRKQVNMRLPLSFLGSGVGLLGIMPPYVSERMAECGFAAAAFRTMDFRDLGKAMQDLNIDLDKDGKKVRIYCEWCASLTRPKAGM